VHVTEQEIGVDGPMREHFAVSGFDTPDENTWRTEACGSMTGLLTD
jgi:hypothetical protein